MTTFKPTMTPEEEAEWAQMVEKGSLFAVEPRGISHGTVTGYNNHRCRCAECKAAMREYWRARAKRRATQEPPRHGTRQGYWAYSCRCALCSEAMSEYCSAYYQRKKARQ
jgi:hypothetical protein